MNLLEMFKNLTEEEKQEFIELILQEIMKKEKEALSTTFLEQVHSSQEAIGGKPLCAPKQCN